MRINMRYYTSNFDLVIAVAHSEGHPPEIVCIPNDCSENVKTDESLKSRVRFLESKVFMLEEALKSVQCLSRHCSAQSETFRQICMEKEETICRMEIDAVDKEKMTEQILGLEKILDISKRRIINQNEHCTKLVEQVILIKHW